MRFDNTNRNATHVLKLMEPEPMHHHVHEAIREHRDGEREPVAFGSSRRYLHASGYARHKLIWGPKLMHGPEEGEPCPECGYPFGDDWENTWYSGKGIEMGEETWKFTCPGCDQQTAEVGT